MNYTPEQTARKVQKELNRQLALAVKDDDKARVKNLVENGANINYKHAEALFYACIGGHLDIVKYLVGAGADIHLADDHALRSAVGTNQLEVVEFLVGAGANVHALKDNVLIIAASHGYLDIWKYLERMFQIDLDAIVPIADTDVLKYIVTQYDISDTHLQYLDDEMLEIHRIKSERHQLEVIEGVGRVNNKVFIDRSALSFYISLLH